MKKITKYLSLTLLMSAVFSCTDLEIEATDSLISEGFAGVADVQGEVSNITNIIAGGVFMLAPMLLDNVFFMFMWASL